MLSSVRSLSSVAVVALAVLVALVAGACGGAGRAAPTTAAAAPSASPSAGAPGPTPQAATEEARVVRVVDGDTLVIDRGRGDERLRYIGVDTPESVKPDSPVEFMGKEAAAVNASLVEGRTVLLETDVSDTDRFGRLLRYVWVEDPGRPGGLLLVNLELVARGYAQVVTFPPDVRNADLFLAAERTAREQGLGLWGPATPAP